MLCFVDEKLQKLQSGWGSAPDPDGGAYSTPPYPLAGREGATPPPAPTPALNQFHLIAFPNPPVSRPAYGPVSPTALLTGSCCLLGLGNFACTFACGRFTLWTELQPIKMYCSFSPVVITILQMLRKVSNPLEYHPTACPGVVQLPRLPSGDHGGV